MTLDQLYREAGHRNLTLESPSKTRAGRIVQLRRLIEDDEVAKLDALAAQVVEDKKAVEDFLAAVEGKSLVEDAVRHAQGEQRRRMRPIEDAAKLDPDDPDYHVKLQELVEEVKANIAADEDEPALDEPLKMIQALRKTAEPVEEEPPSGTLKT